MLPFSQALMDDNKVGTSFDNHAGKREGRKSTLNPAFDFFVQMPQKIQNCLKTHLKHISKNEQKFDIAKPLMLTEKEPCTALDVNLDKQLEAWRENPKWIDPPPEIKVSVPKGSLCKLHVKFKVGLPPDAIYNIIVDPDNKRVFKNIKEVISRKVLVDEGLRQVVEVEQAAIWRFLWWSGTISVHVLVDQNREDHTVRFKQGKSGFMKKFEGCWKVEPLFVDEQICLPTKSKTWADYDLCTGSKGRVGSFVSLDQLIQPALVPPPPFSWYLRGITARTTETLITDLLAEAARLRGAGYAESRQDIETSCDNSAECLARCIKERWRQRRSRKGRRSRRALLVH
ncbi:uncharacterized protein LOC103723369 isoform X1 [Phoenix dactylifera]|uniref:Uncharacterized protein LOC103723369 isoform X1 n=2 Tax=Phoenix dactylifera TaxID=42345 RepID=A0A8B7D3T3_PHODC|nr:uncharacterized protein LOC103723369 isoform X1 [Phoenix dactylifera]